MFTCRLPVIFSILKISNDRFTVKLQDTHCETALGRFYKLALTDCGTILEVDLFVSEGA